MNIVSAAGYITPTVTGVIANSQYKPNVTYPEWSTISGNYLYYSSNWDNTLTIVDITDPTHLIEMSTLHDGDTGAIIKSPKGIMVVGDYAYFINWNNVTNDESVEILNIADKSHPYHVSNFIYTTGTGDKTYSLFVKDDYVYVATAANNSLIIIDARNKTTPVLAGSISNGTGGAKLSYPYGVSVSGNYAYVTAYSGSALEVIDVTNKTSPTHFSYLTNGTGGAFLSGASEIKISGNYAYIQARNNKALEIIDISNPASPTHVGSITDGTNGAKIYGYELAINGNYAYLSGYDASAIEVVNISNPANPTHAGVISDGDNGVALNRPRAISYYNNTVYVSVTGSNRMEVIDVSNPTNPTNINQIDPSLNLGGARFVKIHNGLAYITSNVSNAMQIIDISNKSNPVKRGSVPLRINGAQLYGPLGMDFYGNYAYIVSTGANAGGGGNMATWGALEVVDISNPDNPTHVNSIVGGIFAGASTGGAQNIKIVGNYAYITATSRNAFLVMDIGTNPTNPILVGTLISGTGGASLTVPSGVDIVGNYAYVTTSNALEIINISNPANPTHVGSLTNGTGGALLTSAKYINVVGNYAYISSSGSNALEIVNISNPANPTHVGSLTNGIGGAILGGAYGIAVSDNRAYIGSSTGNALEIIDVSNPASPTHLYSITDGTNGARLISARGVEVNGDYVYIVAYNGSSNAMNIIQIKDSIAPIISEVTPVPSHTKNQTPSYTFTTNEAGTITYGGLCSSSTTIATVGLNTISFNTLSEGTYSNCTITITDALNNISSPLSVSSFTVDVTLPVIKLIGINPINIYVGQEYIDPGATALDDVDGDISSNIINTVNNVKVNIAGTYNVTYNVSDSASNGASELTRTVYVINRPSSGSTLAFRTNFLAQQKALIDTQKKQEITPLSPFVAELLTITKVLKPSIKKDKDVKILQEYLSTILKLNIKPDGVFGKQTKLAIMKFQKEHNLKQDGIVGPKTLKLMK